MRRPVVVARAAQLSVGAALAFGLLVATVYAAAPVASFTISPANPVNGERVTFTSTSTDADNDIDTITWDLDTGNSFNDGSGTTVSRVYTCPSDDSPPCTLNARVRVEDNDENVRIASRNFTVGPNGAPTAAFSASSDSPLTNEQVTFTSSSTDPDGRPLTHRWDTDNDGSFDDGTGSSATRSYPNNTTRTVRLQVTDSGGLVATTTRTITVRNRPPLASFNVSDDSVDTNESIQFTNTSDDLDGDVEGIQWDFNGDGVTDSTSNSPSRSFADDGTQTVTLTVTDDDGDSQTASRQVTINNRLPVASFNMSATEVLSGDPVEFTSTSSDPDGQVKLAEWDFDDDGTTDATGDEVIHSFGDDVPTTVTLTVTDDDDGSRSTSREVQVQNRRPQASFEWAPENPYVGDEVTFTSTSRDRDDEIKEFEWDLDGDGNFGDAEGPQASRSFSQPGSYMVGLLVRDDDGDESERFETVDVVNRPPQSPPAGSNPPGGGTNTGSAIGPRLISPFPTVRIRGVTTRNGARIDLLSVRTPGRTRILVRCKGGGCPWGRKIQRARFSAGRVGTVKIQGFRRRHLRAGAVIQVYVTGPGMIGKYTRFVIRRLKAPRRLDTCTVPGAARVRRCPAS